MVGVYPQVGPSDSPTLERLVEKPGVTWLVMSPATSGNPRGVLRLSVPIHKLFGVSKAALAADDTYQGLYNANPSRIALLTMACFAMSGSGVVGAVTFVAQLTYVAKVFGLSAVGSS